MSTTVQPWPAALPVRQVRIARPTDRLEAIVEFYRDGLGLAELFRFEDHAGYDGVMLGLPGTDYHLEFTRHHDGSPGRAPSLDNLIVLYFDSAGEAQDVAARLERLGHRAVPAENPYWAEHGGVTVEDPDGWRVVLMPSPVF
jgi:catechol 2,3-dioxygenase-like lactoylglutathione lyase family enzyme